MEEKIALLATHKAFFDAYDAQFCKNFHHFQKVLIIPDDENENEKNQPINDDNLSALYNRLFCSDERSVSDMELHGYFYYLINRTDHAEQIITQTFLQMSRDYATYLMRQKIPHLSIFQCFAEAIFFYQTTLSNLYFRMNQQRTVARRPKDPNTADYQQILHGFKALKNADEPVDIHTYYRGIPVVFPAKILSISPTDVSFALHPYQATALELVKMCFISSKQHSHQIFAYANYVNVKSHTAIMLDFAGIDSPVERRSHVRVEPKEAVAVKILADDIELTGLLVDTSILATSTFIHDSTLKTDLIENAEILKLQFSIPSAKKLDESIALEIPAKLYRVYQDPRLADSYRLVFDLFTDMNSERLLSQYVTRRQAEILRELRHLSHP